MKEIVFLTGVIGSGKDYTAALYESNGYRRLSFADGVRDTAWKLLDWTPKNQNEYEDFKFNSIKLVNPKQDIVSSTSGRNFLIGIGDGLRDLVDDKIWIKILERKIISSSDSKFVVSDCRYANEILYFFANYDIRIKFCNYKSFRYKILDSKSEWLATQLLHKGFNDGDEVDISDIIDLYSEYKLKFMVGDNK